MTNKVDPWWVTGLVDGEGCFHVAVRRNYWKNVSLSVTNAFKVELHSDDLPMLWKLQEYFGYGRITQGKKLPTAAFWITKRSELVKVINHFERYPLQSKKRTDYSYWLEAYNLVGTRRFMQPFDFKEVDRLRGLMNKRKGKQVLLTQEIYDRAA